MARIFDRHAKRFDAWYERHAPAYLSELEAVRKVLPKGGRGLEIGVGSGRFAAPLGIRHGIDPSRKLIRIARGRGVEARPGRGEDLPYPDAAFDYAAIIITLCFVEDPAKVLLEARRVLRRDGRLIVGIVDGDSFLGRAYRKKKGPFYRAAHFFGAREVIDLLRATGFVPSAALQTLFDLPGRLRGIQRPKKGFGRGGFVVVAARKSRGALAGVRRDLCQSERIRLLFRNRGYDMEASRQKVLERAGRIEGPVLDVGTGPGRMARAIARAGFAVTTVDRSPAALRVAEALARRDGVARGIRFLRMDARRLAFGDGSFPAVFSANLLHDVDEPTDVVREIARVTRPGGTIVISDLNRRGMRLVSSVRRVHPEVHQGTLIDLDAVVGGILRREGVRFRKHIDGCVTTYVGKKGRQQRRRRNTDAAQEKALDRQRRNC